MSVVVVVGSVTVVVVGSVTVVVGGSVIVVVGGVGAAPPSLGGASAGAGVLVVVVGAGDAVLAGVFTGAIASTVGAVSVWVRPG